MKAIAHHPPARTESLAGMPEVGTTDGVKDDVHALVREAVNFLYEILPDFKNPVGVPSSSHRSEKHYHTTDRPGGCRLSDPI
jgi:hypothetical protein